MRESSLAQPIVLVSLQSRIDQVNQVKTNMESRISDYSSRDENRTAKLAADHLAAAAYWMAEYRKATGWGE